ncbi:hypothetical protein [Clostridium grantii]|uniref:Uncharacterized protein n=1 Tax=Clostridium grantii DSM 8605 TaxID=1121316 RepID=A0A1M5X412_9CLOT|nr:hypothetical protein [Clostridium grantii]SHH94254.1 hypothetical protein SAMN02745207_03302 [Clostridium grantii DSM 8605]
MDSDYNEEMEMNEDFDSMYEMMPMPMMPFFMSNMNMGDMGKEMDPSRINAYNFQNMALNQMMPQQMAGYNMQSGLDEDIAEDEVVEPMRKKKKYDDKYDTQRQVNMVLRSIRRYNPGVFRYLNMYGVPYEASNKIVRRIIRLTLMYSEY